MVRPLRPLSEPVDRVDEQDRVVGVVDRGEAIRRGWLGRKVGEALRITEALIG
jgi:hypothetical protein